jgi:hypothetical protein
VIWEFRRGREKDIKENEIMFHLISKLQKQPEEERRLIVMVASILITALIFFLWVLSGRATIFSRNFSADDNVVIASERDISPLANLKRSLKELTEGTREQLGNIREKFGF